MTLEHFVFEKYQPSGMGIQKWHLLDHMTVAIRKTGGIEFLHGCLYEGAPKIFKSLFKKGSIR